MVEKEAEAENYDEAEKLQEFLENYQNENLAKVQRYKAIIKNGKAISRPRKESNHEIILDEDKE